MKKALHISAISIIIVSIIFIAFMLALRYDEKGEENMPFEISKISIISTVDAQDVEDENNKWNKILEQDNDIYIYISKNDNYDKTEIIKYIKINNFKVTRAPLKGEISFYKPGINENVIFETKEEYKIEELEFIGEQSNNLHNLKISNQGGQVAFRCTAQDIGNFISNEDEISYNDLLKKSNIKYEELKSEIFFDIEIALENGKTFKSTIQAQFPEESIIEDGKSSKEISGEKIVFKRIEN